MASFSLIQPSAEEISSLDFFDKIALVAHNCYQVEAKDHENNIAFVNRLVKAGHLARIEHYRFLLSFPYARKERLLSLNDPYLTLASSLNGKEVLVSFSLRPVFEHRDSSLYRSLLAPLPSSLKENLSLPRVLPRQGEERLTLDKAKTRVSQKDYDRLFFPTYHLITDRGVTHELVRHRPCSFAQESTRYCNYTKGKFSSSLTFLTPLGYEKEKEVYDRYFLSVTETYFRLIEDGLKPEEARSVLPNSLKASIRVSASREEWKHIFSLRLSPFAHPDIRKVMGLVLDDREKKGYIQKDELQG